jgi:two-component sensor histidine kinase
LSAELDHQVKNALARVAAVVRRTQRRCGTTDEFVKAIESRIRSIAAAHALLSQSRWSGVGLTDLIHRQLTPYTTDTGTAISGPGPHAHLCAVSWDCTSADRAAILTISWRELGGSPITAPVQFGYGLSLIRDLVPHELGGAVDLTFSRMARAARLRFASGKT